MERQLATLKLPSYPEKSLSRAISFSELPTSRRIFIQQAESSGGLVKQYSCEQIYDKVSNTRQVNVLTTITSPLSQKDNVWSRPSYAPVPRDNSIGWHRRISSLTTPSKPAIEPASTLSMSSLRISDPPPSRRLNSIETLSTNSSEAPESNYQEEIIEPQQKKSKELKRGVRSLIPKQVSREAISTNLPPRGSSRSPDRRISQSLSKLSFCALISLMMVIIATMLVDFSQRPYDFTNATLELREKIFGQSEAIESLINHFQINSNNFTVILMVGGTGVGKTYTANIIKKHFPYKYNIFELLPPIESHPKIYASLSHLHCNLIIVDNLKMENAREFVNLTKFVQEQKQRPCVVMIGIVNPQVVDEYLVKTVDLERTVGFLDNLIDREKARGKVIPFKSLDSETIGRCIRREAEESQVVLDDKDYREVEAQLAAANSGCKGAYAKVSLFKKKERRRRLDLQWDD